MVSSGVLAVASLVWYCLAMAVPFLVVFLADHPRPTRRQGSGGGPPPQVLRTTGQPLWASRTRCAAGQLSGGCRTTERARCPNSPRGAGPERAGGVEPKAVQALWIRAARVVYRTKGYRLQRIGTCPSRAANPLGALRFIPQPANLGVRSGRLDSTRNHYLPRRVSRASSTAFRRSSRASQH